MVNTVPTENAAKYIEEARLKGEIPKSNCRNADQDPDNQFVQKGDTIDLNDLLFTKERDYLIKNNNQQVCISSTSLTPLLHSQFAYVYVSQVHYALMHSCISITILY